MENDNITPEEDVYTFTVNKKLIRKVLIWTGVAAGAGVILSSAITSVRNEAMLEGYEIAQKEDELLEELESSEETSEKSE